MPFLADLGFICRDAGEDARHQPTGGRTTAVVHRDGANAVLADYGYAYDPADRLTSKTEGGVATAFGYDHADQLTADGGTAFAYDGTGNRTTAGYTTGPGNRLTSDGTWAYTYDAAGQVVKRSKGASAETWTYAYDHDGRLTGASRSATDGGAATATVAYTYDAWGNRLGRTAWDGATTTTERWAYDGWDPAKPAPVGTENFDPWADLDGANAVTARRLWGAGFDDPEARAAGAAVSWYAADLTGSVRKVLNASGAVTHSATYDAFGNLTAGAPADRYGYAGREWDGVAQTYYNRDRVYDPRTGRFLSEDPAGLAPDVNPYRYVENQPTTRTDPSGRWIFAPRSVRDGNGVSVADAFVAWLKKGDIRATNSPLQERFFPWNDGYNLIQIHPEDRDKFANYARAEHGEGWAQSAVNAGFGDVGGKNVLVVDHSFAITWVENYKGDLSGGDLALAQWHERNFYEHLAKDYERRGLTKYLPPPRPQLLAPGQSPTPPDPKRLVEEAIRNRLSAEERERLDPAAEAGLRAEMGGLVTTQEMADRIRNERARENELFWQNLQRLQLRLALQDAACALGGLAAGPGMMRDGINAALLGARPPGPVAGMFSLPGVAPPPRYGPGLQAPSARMGELGRYTSTLRQYLGVRDGLPGGVRSQFRPRDRETEVVQGTVAVGELVVAGETTQVPGFSGMRNVPGFAPYVPNAQRTLRATEVVGGRGNPYFRDVDPEAKILERMLQLTTENTRGTLRLYVDRVPCPSCTSMIVEFQRQRPGIAIEVGLEGGSVYLPALR